MAITSVGDIAFLLEIAPRLGTETDEPEGTRYIQLSETLTNQIVSILRQHAMRHPAKETMIDKKDIKRLFVSNNA